MTGMLLRVNAGPAFNGLGLPSVRADVVDVAAGLMAGLEHYMDPAFLNGADQLAYSKGDGRLITMTGSTVEILENDDASGDRTVLYSNGGGVGLQVGPGGINSTSFTIVAMCTLSSAMRDGAADGYLWSVYKAQAGGFQQLSRLIGSGGAWSFGGGGSGSANVARASVPAAGVPFIVAASYDAATTAMRVYFNTTSSPVGSSDSCDAPVADELSRLHIGYALAAPTTNWIGRIGKTLLFNKAFHTNADDLAQLQNLMTSMRTYYGIA